MASVLVVERNPEGHRLSYARVLLDAGVARGWSMCLMMPRDRMADQEVDLFLGGRLYQVEETAPVTSTRAWVRAVELASRARDCAVVVPDGDHFLASVGLRGAWRGGGDLVGLVLRDPTEYHMRTLRGRVSSSSKKLLLRRAGGLPRVTPLRLCGQARPAGEGWVRDPVRLTSDPRLERTFRDEMGDRQWFGVLGRIDRRKSVAEVAEAAALVSMTRAPVGLLLRGRCDALALKDAEHAFERLRQAGGNVTIDDRLCTDAELDSTVAALDCLVVAHTNEGPSGILGKALGSGTRVVAAGAHSLQRDVSLSSAGRWSTLDPHALSEAMIDVLNRPKPPAVAVADEGEFSAGMLDAVDCAGRT